MNEVIIVEHGFDFGGQRCVAVFSNANAAKALVKRLRDAHDTDYVQAYWFPVLSECPEVLPRFHDQQGRVLMPADAS